MTPQQIKANAPEGSTPYKKFKYCRRCSSYKDVYSFRDDDWKTSWCISCENTPVGEIAKR